MKLKRSYKRASVVHIQVNECGVVYYIFLRVQGLNVWDESYRFKRNTCMSVRLIEQNKYLHKCQIALAFKQVQLHTKYTC
jgi:hypothetical protein